MDLYKIYSKTTKGVRAIASRPKALSRDSMRVLALIDGQINTEALLEKSGKFTAQKLCEILDILEKEGYVSASDSREDLLFQYDIPAPMEVAEISAEEFLALKDAVAPDEKLVNKATQDLSDAARKERQAAEARAKAFAEEQLRLAAEAKKQAESERKLLAAAASPIAEPLQREKHEKTETPQLAEAAAQAKREAEARARREAEEKARIAAERKAREEAEARARAEAAAQAKREAEAKARAEAEAQARREAEEQARMAAERKAREEAEARAKAEAAAQAKREAEAKARAEAEAQARREAEEQARMAAEREAREEAEARAKAEAAAQAKREAEARARAEVEARARREAEEQARMAAERKARDEAKVQAKAEAAAQAKRAAEAKARAEVEAKARREAEEQARIAAEWKTREEAKAEEKRETEAWARREADEQARITAEQKAREEAEAQSTAEAAAQAKREAEARALSEAVEEARITAERTAREEAEAQARTEADAKAKRKAEEKARIAAERAARKQAEAEIKAEARLQAKRYTKARALPWTAAIVGMRRMFSVPDLNKLFRSASVASRNLLIALVIVTLSLLGLLHVVNLSVLVGPIEKLAAENFNEPVTIKEVHASLWPQPHLVLEGVTIGRLADLKGITISVMPVLSTVFDETKTLKSIEIEALTLDQESLSRPLKWVSSSSSQGKLIFNQVALKKASIKLPDLELPPFDGEIRLTSSGGLQDATLTADDRSLTIEIIPKNDIYTVNVVAHKWRSPFGTPVVFDELRAKGVADHRQITFSQIEGRLYGGSIKALMTVNWANAWTATGNFELSKVNLEESIPSFTSDASLKGRLNTNASFSLKADELAKLADAPDINASFDAQNGYINGIDLVRAMQASGKARTAGGSTRFDTLSGQLQLKDGHYQYRQLTLKARQFQVRGEVDVYANKDLSAKLNIEVAMKSRQLQSYLSLSGKLGSPTLN